MNTLEQHYWDLTQRTKTANLAGLRDLAKGIGKTLRTPVSELSKKEIALGGLGSLGAIAAAKGLAPELAMLPNLSAAELAPLRDTLMAGAKDAATVKSQNMAYVKDLMKNLEGRSNLLPGMATSHTKQVLPSHLDKIMANIRTSNAANTAIKDAKNLVSSRFSDSSILGNPVIKDKLPALKELLYNDYIAGSSLAISPTKAVPYAGILADIGDIGNQLTMLKYLNQSTLPANIKNIVANPDLVGLAKKPVAEFYNPILKALSSKGSNLRTALSDKSNNIAAMLAKQNRLPFDPTTNYASSGILNKDLSRFTSGVGKDIVTADQALSKGFKLPYKRQLDELKRVAEEQDFIPWTNTSSIANESAAGAADLSADLAGEKGLEEAITAIIKKKAPEMLASSGAKEIPLLGQAIGVVGAAKDAKAAHELQRVLTEIRRSVGANPTSWESISQMSPDKAAVKETMMDIGRAMSAIKAKSQRTAQEVAQHRIPMYDLF